MGDYCTVTNHCAVLSIASLDSPLVYVMGLLRHAWRVHKDDTSQTWEFTLAKCAASEGFQMLWVLQMSSPVYPARSANTLAVLLQHAPAVHLGVMQSQVLLSAPIVRLGSMQLQKWHRAPRARLANFPASRKLLVCRVRLVILPRKADLSASSPWPQLQ